MNVYQDILRLFDIIELNQHAPNRVDFHLFFNALLTYMLREDEAAFKSEMEPHLAQHSSASGLLAPIPPLVPPALPVSAVSAVSAVLPALPVLTVTPRHLDPMETLNIHGSDCVKMTNKIRIFKEPEEVPAPMSKFVGRLSVVFDLDETLISADSYGNYSTRPYARSLLKFLAAAGVEAIVWSAGGYEHVDNCLKILNTLDNGIEPNEPLISYAICRGAWFDKDKLRFYSGSRYIDYPCKDLRKISHRPYKIHIDNTVFTVYKNPGHAIIVPDFAPRNARAPQLIELAQEDNYLLFLLPVLLNIQNSLIFLPPSPGAVASFIPSILKEHNLVHDGKSFSVGELAFSSISYYQLQPFAELDYSTDQRQEFTSLHSVTGILNVMLPHFPVTLDSASGPSSTIAATRVISPLLTVTDSCSASAPIPLFSPCLGLPGESTTRNVAADLSHLACMPVSAPVSAQELDVPRPPPVTVFRDFFSSATDERRNNAAIQSHIVIDSDTCDAALALSALAKS